jgi:hypothetical protein
MFDISFILMDVRCFIIPVKIALCTAQKKWKKKTLALREGGGEAGRSASVDGCALGCV